MCESYMDYICICNNPSHDQCTFITQCHGDSPSQKSYDLLYVCTCTLQAEPSPQPTSPIYKIIHSIFQKPKELSSKSSLRAAHSAQEPGVYRRYYMLHTDTAKSTTKSLLGQTKADCKRNLDFRI